jgi:hypothetical protein
MGQSQRRDVCMHVVHNVSCNVLMNYDCTTHPILPFITITTTFLSKRCIKGHFTQRWMAITVSILQKNFLTLRPYKQAKNVKFSLSSIIETSPREGAWLFRGSAELAEILRGDAKRSQVRCAPPHTSTQNPAMHSNWNILIKLALSPWQVKSSAIRHRSLFLAGAGVVPKIRVE